MVSRAGSCSSRSARARIVSSTGCDPSKATCSFSPTPNFCETWRRDGLGFRTENSRNFLLGTANLSTLTYEHKDPVIVSTQCPEESK